MIFMLSAECGDFVQEDYPDHTYLSSYKFVPHQDAELERRIMENHRKLVYVPSFVALVNVLKIKVCFNTISIHQCPSFRGQSPAEADLNLLETARRCELFGMKMHPAKVCILTEKTFAIHYNNFL